MPSYAIGIIVFSYWAYVVAKLIRMRRKSKWREAAIPRQPLERAMWFLWIPVIVSWIALPFVAENQSPERHPWLATPEAVRTAPWLAARWCGVALGLMSFGASLVCWRFMGRSWRMATDAKMTTLLTGGPFGFVRHPIYSLSMALMLSTVLASPGRFMYIVAVIHVMLLTIKTINEERFLGRTHGDRYSAYIKRTGRFLPRLFLSHVKKSQP